MCALDLTVLHISHVDRCPSLRNVQHGQSHEAGSLEDAGWMGLAAASSHRSMLTAGAGEERPPGPRAAAGPRADFGAESELR